jgi:hypothetical protein
LGLGVQSLSSTRSPATKEDILRIIGEVKPGRFIPIVGTPGAGYPFIGRKKEREQIYRHFVDRMKNVDKSDKNVSSILYVAGLPGTGKSKLNIETKNILEQYYNELSNGDGTNLRKYLQHSVFIHVTYHNNMPFLPEELTMDKKLLNHALCVRVLYFYIHPEEGFKEFAKRLSKYKLKMKKVIAAVAEREHARHVHIGVDEYNKLMEAVYENAKQRLNNEDAKETACRALRNLVLCVKSSMGTIRKEVVSDQDTDLLATPLSAPSSHQPKEFPTETVLVTAMFTGTVRDGMGTHLFGSEGKKDELAMTELSMHEVCDLLKLLLQKKMLKVDPVIVFSCSVLQAFSIAGRVPRAMEFLVIELSNKGRTDYSTGALVKEMTMQMKKQYKLSNVLFVIGDDGTYQLLRYCILQETVPYNTTFTDRTIKDLETNGYIILNDTGKGYKINIPFVWMYSYLQFLKSYSETQYPGKTALYKALKVLIETISAKPDAAWSYFERFCVSYRLAFIRMYQHKNNTEYVTLKEIWPGVLTKHTTVLDHQISIREVNDTLHQCAQWFPQSKGNVPQSCIGFNAHNAPGIDGFLRNGSDVVSEQYRHSVCNEKSIPTVTLEEVVKSCAESLTQLHTNGCTSKGHLFLTNKPLRNTLLENIDMLVPHAVGIIHRDNLSNHFPYALAGILKNMSKSTIYQSLT